MIVVLPVLASWSQTLMGMVTVALPYTTATNPTAASLLDSMVASLKHCDFGESPESSPRMYHDCSSDGEKEEACHRKLEWLDATLNGIDAQDVQQSWIFDENGNASSPKSAESVPSERDVVTPFRGVLLDPRGNCHIIPNEHGASKAFALEHGLNKTDLSKLLHGKIHSHRGWKRKLIGKVRSHKGSARKHQHAHPRLPGGQAGVS